MQADNQGIQPPELEIGYVFGEKFPVRNSLERKFVIRENQLIL